MGSRIRILLVDPDPVLAPTLMEHLAAAGHGVAEAGGAATPTDCDLVVVDEATGGAETCRRLKREGCPAPVLLLGNGEGGADFRLAKPVRLTALMAAIGQVAARARNGAGERLGPWRFNRAARLLEDAEGRRVRLTDKEAAILDLLAASGEVVPRERLLAEVWGYSTAMATHTLETHIYRLRRKIEADPANATLLVTEAGGYRLVS